MMIDSETEIKFLKDYCTSRANIIKNLRRLSRKGKNESSSNAIANAEIDTTFTTQQSTALDERFKQLLLSLQTEGFFDTDECVREVSQAKISTTTHGKWKEGKQHLQEAIKTMRSFGINKFVDRYNEYNHASHALKGKNIVLFLGSTGVGKSTTIHYLCGSQMQKNKNGHISAVAGKNKNSDYLKRIELLDTVGESVTKYITPVPVNLFDIVPDLEKKNKNENKGNEPELNNVDPNPNLVVLCDTPGFEDSGGVEIKLANTLSLLDCMYAANQITIVFLINRDLISSVGRSVAFKQSAENLKNLLRHLIVKNLVPMMI